ncbi:metalloregulator ArsR/SmtB family transcription factor [Saccharothrix violaceirubra]|uniref:DNA-binding transcriptional ArsR family regulator n=1 Tax=Saccharothrix violaceirubra TaxID=413306 RepID=A0A7W7WXW4_9PSEU|nr:metalloregulator ArsR/SmtB family transcription factor [Saccharothrix violaceirubra]MBB4967471.1 DNA-binding transcriptional ArsR family regulator [Saccharothrix violaceirubra]
MNEVPAVDQETAEVYASWFRALSDPSRIRILNLLARQEAPMSVGEVVDAVDIGQSTVSHHLKILREVGFVVGTREGTSTRYEVNRACVTKFPTAADVVMGVRPDDS